MLGRGVVTIQVKGLSVNFKVWVAAVQDPCILSLDFLRAAQYVLDLGRTHWPFLGAPQLKWCTPYRLQDRTCQV